MPLEITITNEQKVRVTLHPTTLAGNPAPVENTQFSVIDGDSTFAVVTDDPNSADLISSDNPGDTQFLVKADADLGEGVEEISDIIKLTVSGAHAGNLGLQAAAPELK